MIYDLAKSRRDLAKRQIFAEISAMILHLTRSRRREISPSGKSWDLVHDLALAEFSSSAISVAEISTR